MSEKKHSSEHEPSTQEVPSNEAGEDIPVNHASDEEPEALEGEITADEPAETEETEEPEEPALSAAAQAYFDDLPDDVETLKAEALASWQRAEEAVNDLKRTAAEFANYRRRMTEEGKLLRQRGIREAFEVLVPLFDDIDQGVKNSKEPSPEQLEKGLKLLQQKARHLLGTMKIELVDPTGQTFDPTTSEAITTVPVPGVEPNTVIDTIGMGYRLGDVIIRPAKVVVAAEQG